MNDSGPVVTGLCRWTARHDLHVRAAVELLIEHETWIRRQDFTQCCMEHGSCGVIMIDWRKAREFAGSSSRASTSEMAILDLAVALAEDRYRLSIMGEANTWAIIRAITRALGEEAPR